MNAEHRGVLLGDGADGRGVAVSSRLTEMTLSSAQSGRDHSTDLRPYIDGRYPSSKPSTLNTGVFSSVMELMDAGSLLDNLKQVFFFLFTRSRYRS